MPQDSAIHGIIANCMRKTTPAVNLVVTQPTIYSFLKSNMSLWNQKYLIWGKATIQIRINDWEWYTRYYWNCDFNQYYSASANCSSVKSDKIIIKIIDAMTLICVPIFSICNYFLP